MWWLPLVIGGAQTIYGRVQAYQAKEGYEDARRERDRNRPTMPEDVNRMVSMAQRSYVEGMPMRSYYEDVIAGRAATGTAAMREGAMTSTEFLSGVSELNRQSLTELNTVATQETLYRMEQEKQLMGALQARAQYDYQLQGMKYGEAQQDMGAYAEMRGAGIQNMWGGVQTMAGAAMQKYSADQQMQQLDKMYGGERVNYGNETPWGTEVFTDTSTDTYNMPRWSELGGSNKKPETPTKVQSSFYMEPMDASMTANSMWSNRAWDERFSEWGIKYY